MKKNQDRLIISEDRKTAILDKTIHLKAINPIGDGISCKGCYLQRKEDGRCKDRVEGLSVQGARCVTPFIIWVEDTEIRSIETEKTAEYTKVEDFLSLVYRVLTTCGPEEAKALLLQVPEKGFIYSKVLLDCFIFDRTAQGHDYWRNISEKLGEE